MALQAGYYAGREQAFVKHHFLKNYLQRLIHKIASGYSEIIYVDGFSGPWQNRDERFEDTSFGIALQSLTEAKRTWASMPQRPKQVRMVAHLVEKDRGAYERLSKLQELFPDVEVITHNGDFIQIATTIAGVIPNHAFSFVLIDPKGFSLDLQALHSLVGRERCEIVFNFMFDFVNRFALLDSPTIAPILDRLIPGEDWREPLRAMLDDPIAHPEKRKRVLIDAFSRAISSVGGFEYVADVDVRRPDSDRTLYFLVYGTRQPEGIKVFRDCQIQSLNVQSDMLARKKVTDQSTASNQFELYGSMHEMAPDQNRTFLDDEASKASQLLLDIVPTAGPGVPWRRVWPKILAKHAIRWTDLNKIANEFRKEGKLLFPEWPSGRKSIPEDNYKVLRGRAEQA